MKKINKVYFATEKDGSLEKNMAELPENPGGYSAVLISSDEPKFVEKDLHVLAETEEDIHPAMSLPLSGRAGDRRNANGLAQQAGDGETIQQRRIDENFARLEQATQSIDFGHPRERKRSNSNSK